MAMESSSTGSATEANPPSAQTQSRGGAGRGRGRGNGRGRGGRSSENSGTQDQGRQGQQGNRRGKQGGGQSTGRGGRATTMSAGDLTKRFSGTPDGAATTKPDVKATAGENAEEEEGETCWICASTIVHESVAPCNHRTCHICALRMRGLYKDKNCATCRTPADFVIFTDSSTKNFEDFTKEDLKCEDVSIGVKYDDPEIQQDVFTLLQYNCPDAECPFASSTHWPGLHAHVKKEHHKKICDLCARFKKVFTHEQSLFTDQELQKHIRVGDDTPGAVDQSGFKGHPKCQFCGNHWYGDDELYIHCRQDHERCFICDRITGGRPQYFRNFQEVNQHFQRDHFACLERECVEKRFVAFATEIDLKVHQLAEHGGTLSKDTRRDLAQVDLSDFNLREPFSFGQGRGNHRGEGQREGRGRGRGRDPNAEPIPNSSAQPLRRDEVAFQRQMAIHSAQSISTRSFGGQLTAPTPAAQPRTSQPSSQLSMTLPRPSANVEAATQSLSSLGIAPPDVSPQDMARQTRNRAVIERATILLKNDADRITQFRNYISSFKNGNLTAPALIQKFFELFSETPPASLGTLIREIADLYEDPRKADAIRAAWNDWRSINEDYPSLPAIGPSTSSAIPLNWARSSAGNGNTQQKSTRVLKIKESTVQSSRSGLSQNRSWGTASSSSSRPNPSGSDPTPGESFPGLPGPSNRPTNPNSRINTIPWVASPANGNNSSGQSSARPTPPTSRPASRVSGGTDAFPALPKAKKPQSTIMMYGNGRMVRRDVGAFAGGNAPSGSPWGGGGESSNGGGGEGEEEDESGGNGGKGKKKGNKGKKQVLLNWG